MAKDSDWHRVKTTETAFEIIELLQRRQGCTLAEIANSLDLVKSTVHRHLGTLEQLGYVIRENGRYRVSFKFLKLGEYARHRIPEYQAIKEKVEELAEQTGERANVMVEEQGYSVYVFSAYGESAVKTSPLPGSRIPIHASSSGKAILSTLAREEVEHIIDRHGLEPVTENTITGRDALFEELETIRSQEYAINDEESLSGLFAIAVPLQKADGETIGALAIAGPVRRMKPKVNDYIDLLLGISNELILNISHSES